MSINIQAKTNYSFLFSGLSSTASNAASSNWLADYASIKNGSYAKLMKAYYGKENNASKTAASDITKKDTTTETALRAGLSFAAEEKKTQVPPTTGWIPKKCTKNSKPSRKTA